MAPSPPLRPTESYDLAVIGSGPAGIAAALQGAKLGKKVVLIEASQKHIGGAWIHTGTLPSKTLRELSASLNDLRSQIGGAWAERIVGELSAAQVNGRAQAVSSANEQLVRDSLRDHDVDVINGRAMLLDPHTLSISAAGQAPLQVKALFTLIATGSRPRRPADVPFDGWRVVDSDEILKLTALPKSLLIFGAGVIGCEYACIFSALGTEVSICDARTRIMQTLDNEIAAALQQSMESMGIRFKLGGPMPELRVAGPRTTALFADETLSPELFFFAAGRESVSQNMGLESIGINLNQRGDIVVDKRYQTSVPSVFAAGDVIGPPALAVSSREQGRIAVNHAFNIACADFPAVFPVGVYTIPELSSVGLSEEDCIRDGLDYVVGRAPYSSIARGYIRGDAHGLLKLITDRQSLKILGVHILGADACNLIHIGQCLMLAGMSLPQILNNVIFNYPTLAEAYRVACLDTLQAIYPAGIPEDLSRTLSIGYAA